MSMSKKCLNEMCNEYENASKINFKSCTDCAYLFKPSKAYFFKLICKIAISVLLVSMLLFVVFTAGKSFLQNQKNNKESLSPTNVINKQTEQTEPTEPVEPIKQATETGANTSSDNSETVLKVHGSNTIGAKLMPKLVIGYLDKIGAVEVKEVQGTDLLEKRIEFKFSAQDEKKYDVEIYSHGSSTAFNDLKSGACDIGMSSRKITQNEIDMLNAAGIGNLSTLKSETIIALDGISVIVNKSNPITQLSVKQISEIFSGKITNWSKVGGKEGKIKVFSRDNNSGTSGNFKTLVLSTKSLLPEASIVKSAQDISTEVSKDINAIGFTSFSSAGDTKTLAISQGNVAPVFPDAFNIATEDYFLSERMYLYCPESKQNSYAAEIMNYITDEGQEIIKANNFSTINIEVDENFKPLTKPSFKSQEAQQKYDQFISNTQARLSINFLFKNASYELDNKSIKDLEKVINFLFRSKYINSKILLVGYSDSTGDYDMNVNLSKQRALQVQGIILKQFGVLDGRVDALGMGPELPISSNDTNAGKAKNRRVEVYIMADSN